MLANVVIAKKDATFFEKCVKQFDIPGLLFGRVDVNEKNVQFTLSSDDADTFFWVGVWYATKDSNRKFLIYNQINKDESKK